MLLNVIDCTGPQSCVKPLLRYFKLDMNQSSHLLTFAVIYIYFLLKVFWLAGAGAKSGVPISKYKTFSFLFLYVLGCKTFFKYIFFQTDVQLNIPLKLQSGKKYFQAT